jgi:hypothetical protein
MESMRAIVITALLAFGLPLAAQSWDRLSELRPGDRIRVLDTTGETRTGEFVSSTADSLSIRTRRAESTLSRSSIRRVQVSGGKRRVRNLAIGAAIGLGLGLLADNSLGRYLRNEGLDIARPATYAVPIGAGAGIGAALPAYRTVYRAK